MLYLPSFSKRVTPPTMIGNKRLNLFCSFISMTEAWPWIELNSPVLLKIKDYYSKINDIMTFSLKLHVNSWIFNGDGFFINLLVCCLTTFQVSFEPWLKSFNFIPISNILKKETTSIYIHLKIKYNDKLTLSKSTFLIDGISRHFPLEKALTLDEPTAMAITKVASNMFISNFNNRIWILFKLNLCIYIQYMWEKMI